MAIDLIEVAGKYMISCFELAAGLTFDESVIQTSTFSSKAIDEGRSDFVLKETL